MAQLFKLKYIKYKNKYNTLKKQLENLEVNNVIDLTETPTLSNQMVGGSVTTTAIIPPCAGIVNPMPDVTVPMNQDGGSCAGIVNPQPVITLPVAPLITSSVPLVTSNKNYSVNESEVNNTEDIERLFKQIGGGHKKHHSRESSDSSIFDSESSSLFGSDFDELISE